MGCRFVVGGSVEASVRARHGLLVTERVAAHTERGQRDAGGVQQTGHVVVGRDEQRGGIGEREVVDEQSRIDVTVRGDDREITDLVEDATGDRPGRGVRWQQTVRMQHEVPSCRAHPPSVRPMQSSSMPVATDRDVTASTLLSPANV